LSRHHPVLFSIGRFLLGLYLVTAVLAQPTVQLVLVIILALVYYAAQIFGAEFTRFMPENTAPKLFSC